MKEPIYVDHHAGTPLDKRVLNKMLPFFCDVFGNAASIDHIHGFMAKKAVDKARGNIAKCLGCRKTSEVIFTSGATEANNLALIGTFLNYQSKGTHIISSVIEHPSVMDTLEYLKTQGADITLVSVDEYGLIDVEHLEKAIREDTVLISIMYANNEIGTIQNIKEIGEIAKEHGVLFHTDAAQALGYIDIDVYKENIDLMSFSAHKFYGPKGIGGLFVRSYAPHIRLKPLINGGGHERGMRSGTLNVPGIVGMAEALTIARKEMRKENKRLFELSKNIFSEIKQNFPEVILNGHPQQKLAHNLSITIPGVESKGLIHILKDRLSFSTGAACSTTKVRPSHVLKAIGLKDEETYQTIRLGLGRDNTEEDGIAEVLIEGIKQLTDQLSS